MSPDRHARTMLPIPDRAVPGLTTYDAKDPDTAFPPIEPLLPPEGARHPGVRDHGRRADPEGRHQVRMEFAYDGGGLAKGGDVTLYYDGTAIGTGRVEATQAMIFSADETTDIGYESGTTVSADYTAYGSRFTGKINWVQIDLGADDHDHFIDPDERLRIAMARQ
jgi:hypothetical protein